MRRERDGTWSKRELGGLAAGVLAVLGLVAASSIVTTRELSRVRSDVSRLAAHAARSTALASSIGRHVAQTRAEVLQALTEPTGGAADGEVFARTTAELARTGKELERDLAELHQLLDEETRELWSVLAPELPHVTDLPSQALGALLRGDPAAAEETFDRYQDVAGELQRNLDLLVERSADESARLLEAADARLEQLAEFLTVAALVVLAGTATVFVLLGGLVSASRREIARQVARVEQTNRDLDTFAGRAAHDLRNVLAPVSAGALALRRSADDPRVRDTAELIERSAKQGLATLEGLLALARGGSPQPGAASVSAVLDDVLDERETLVSEVGAEIERDVEDVEIAVSPSLLHSVLANLVDNALKFLRGRPERHLTIRCRTAGGSCELTVRDTGPGIPPDELERIFEPFYRASDASAPGTGLGLAMVKRIVDVHGGTVEAHSTPGEGATFRLRLPLRAHEPRPPFGRRAESGRERAGRPAE